MRGERNEGMKMARKTSPAPMEDQWKVCCTNRGMTESKAVMSPPCTTQPQRATRRRREARRVNTGGYLDARLTAGGGVPPCCEVCGARVGLWPPCFSSRSTADEMFGAVPSGFSSSLLGLCPSHDVLSGSSTSSTCHCRAIFFSIRASRSIISKNISPKAM